MTFSLPCQIGSDEQNMGQVLQDDTSAPQSKHVEGTIRGLCATCPLVPRDQETVSIYSSLKLVSKAEIMDVSG